MTCQQYSKQSDYIVLKTLHECWLEDVAQGKADIIWMCSVLNVHQMSAYFRYVGLSDS